MNWIINWISFKQCRTFKYSYCCICQSGTEGMKGYFVKFADCSNEEDTAATRLKSKHESQQ